MANNSLPSKQAGTFEPRIGCTTRMWMLGCVGPRKACTGLAATFEPNNYRKDQFMSGVADKLDKAYEGQRVEDLAAAPVAALQGVSDGDAEHLRAAFNIVTVKDLGTNKFFLWAQAIAKLAE